ncbi:ATP-binding protein [Streptosporangium sp. NPDC049376]
MSTDPSRSFAALLRAHRYAAGLTIEELAEASALSGRAIGDMERGRSRAPRSRSVEALADALGLDAEARRELIDAAKAGRPSPRPAPGTRLFELPRSVGDFTGRSAELAKLRELAALSAPGGGSPVVAVLSGLPGLGKTTLALWTAHALTSHFPGGSTFLDLRGTDKVPLGVVAALTRLLHVLGVEHSRIPRGAEELTRLYRSLTRERRMLLVLDNAADEAQVRPLLPACGSCMIVVTSRRPLAGLESVHRMELDTLPPSEAVELLTRIIGEHRSAEDPQATAQVAALCGNLPLALRIAGNRLASRPGWTVAHLGDRLVDSDRRLTALVAGDLRVDVVFELSYSQLSPVAAAVFRLLSLAPGGGFAVPLASVLVGIDEEETTAVLEELVDLSLLQATHSDRYRFHDLMLLFAQARLRAEEPVERVRQAEKRMRAWLLHTAIGAGQLFSPSPVRAVLPDTALRFSLREPAAAWLDTEADAWLAAVGSAAADGEHQLVLDVAEAMHWFSDLRGHWPHWLTLFSLSTRAARALGCRRQETVHLNYCAWTLTYCLGRHREGLEHAARAFVLAGQVGDLREQAWALFYQGGAHLSLARRPEACPLGTEREHLERAAEHFNFASRFFVRSGDFLGHTVAARKFGEVLRELGDPVTALLVHTGLLGIYLTGRPEFPATQRDLGVGLCLQDIGDDLAAQGRWQEAADHYHRALPYFSAAGDVSIMALLLYSLGRACTEMADHPQARDHLEQAMTLFTETGDLNGQSRVRQALDDL